MCASYLEKLKPTFCRGSYQSINQSLFQAEAHRTTNNKENANTGNRTEQTHKRIQVKNIWM